MITMDADKKAVLDRIKHLQDAIFKANQYLANGEHADWHGFRALFVDKVRDGKLMPPHKDWIKNVFLPRTEKVLKENQKILDKLDLRRKRSG
jgi:hypothetical protein